MARSRAASSRARSRRTRGRWYCNLVVEYMPKPLGKHAGVGIDLSLKDAMTLSTGAKVENSRAFAKYEADLARAQRANKARRVKAIHAKIANTRKHFPAQGDDQDRRRLRADLCRQRIGTLAPGEERQVGRRCQHGDVTQHAAVQGDGARSEASPYASPLRPVPTAWQSADRKARRVSKYENGPAAAAAWFMTVTWLLLETFSAWDVWCLQKEAQPSARSARAWRGRHKPISCLTGARRN